MALDLSFIRSYEWRSHSFELTNTPRSKRWNSFFSDVNGRVFVVMVRGIPVYAGAFVSPYSSIPCPLPVIIQPLATAPDGGDSLSLSISLGYPSETFYVGEDPRYSAAIRQVLEEAGKLRN